MLVYLLAHCCVLVYLLGKCGCCLLDRVVLVTSFISVLIILIEVKHTLLLPTCAGVMIWGIESIHNIPILLCRYTILHLIPACPICINNQLILTLVKASIL